MSGPETSQARQDNGCDVSVEAILAVFTVSGMDRLSSAELADSLGISKKRLARLLGSFGVSPGTIRLPDGRTLKGYYRKAFPGGLETSQPSVATKLIRYRHTMRMNFRSGRRSSSMTVDILELRLSGGLGWNLRDDQHFRQSRACAVFPSDTGAWLPLAGVP
jgi:hypothetical protein